MTVVYYEVTYIPVRVRICLVLVALEVVWVSSHEKESSNKSCVMTPDSRTRAPGSRAVATIVVLGPLT